MASSRTTWVRSLYYADQIFLLVSIGIRPFVELSFMLETLASGCETVFRYRGNVTPPQDYGEWAMLIGKLVRQHAWVDMDEPTYLSALEVEQLRAVSRVVKESVGWRYEGRTIHLDCDLLPHGVAAITLEFRNQNDARIVAR